MSRLLLLSGGIDSIALAAWLRPELCLTIRYGQQAADAEVQSSTHICQELKLRHQVLEVAHPLLGSGCMAGEASSPHSPHEEFWPFRNQYLITLAAMVAIQSGLGEVLIGTVATDKRHADGSPEFLQAIDKVIGLQEGAIHVRAPAAELTTEQLVQQSGISMAVLAWAHSCHTSTLACGRCPGCHKHSQVMASLGMMR
ncbi:TPA: 7-cyano-7-deazaguanine synthase [Pseudomonas aeruginosa]|uniref:7-cyano-7-deazaguanine synthase n=1 Tax=Pseudomonas TaxID=286 RepID=UPI000F7967C4|nr:MULTISPECIES: 7-cyano-7-deazaguanine synthase [Pseudomonas]MBR7823003.1 7-cyano-7-deazaguanine synthase [Pseudomonas aeruginosa]MBR7851243.1 7-cyano-7-deazaguanine synthase [Pseudomonas aeruginosa]MBR7863905.1 7-cyano-7-deazaguanine synthase [Pseudomonas aeruginosa]MBR7870676.1 7-cyano-7-deazaguanine synthase [Pseudomonas aeruginosa]MBW6202522.1 7-cyano-7-deazaguanine synthase [Pseudomonas aeruginosa]